MIYKNYLYQSQLCRLLMLPQILRHLILMDWLYNVLLYVSCNVSQMVTKWQFKFMGAMDSILTYCSALFSLHFKYHLLWQLPEMLNFFKGKEVCKN